MPSRVIERYALLPDRARGYGRFTGVSGSPADIPFRFSKLRSALTASEQTDFDSIRSFLVSYHNSEEVPSGFLQHFVYEFSIVTNAAGDTPVSCDARGASIRMRIGSNGPLLSVPSGWSKILSAFTAGEQVTLNAHVDALLVYLAAEFPLPPW